MQEYYNLKRHFTTTHDKYVEMAEEEKKRESKRLSASIATQASMFKKTATYRRSPERHAAAVSVQYMYQAWNWCPVQGWAAPTIALTAFL